MLCLPVPVGVSGAPDLADPSRDRPINPSASHPERSTSARTFANVSRNSSDLRWLSFLTNPNKKMNPPPFLSGKMHQVACLFIRVGFLGRILRGKILGTPSIRNLYDTPIKTHKKNAHETNFGGL